MSKCIYLFTVFLLLIGNSFSGEIDSSCLKDDAKWLKEELKKNPSPIKKLLEKRIEVAFLKSASALIYLNYLKNADHLKVALKKSMSNLTPRPSSRLERILGVAEKGSGPFFQNDDVLGSLPEIPNDESIKVSRVDVYLTRQLMNQFNEVEMNKKSGFKSILLGEVKTSSNPSNIPLKNKKESYDKALSALAESYLQSLSSILPHLETGCNKSDDGFTWALNSKCFNSRNQKTLSASDKGNDNLIGLSDLDGALDFAKLNLNKAIKNEGRKGKIVISRVNPYTFEVEAVMDDGLPPTEGDLNYTIHGCADQHGNPYDCDWDVQFAYYSGSEHGKFVFTPEDISGANGNKYYLNIYHTKNDLIRPKKVVVGKGLIGSFTGSLETLEGNLKSKIMYELILNEPGLFPKGTKASFIFVCSDAVTSEHHVCDIKLDKNKVNGNKLSGSATLNHSGRNTIIKIYFYLANVHYKILPKNIFLTTQPKPAKVIAFSVKQPDSENDRENMKINLVAEIEGAIKGTFKWICNSIELSKEIPCNSKISRDKGTENTIERFQIPWPKEKLRVYVSFIPTKPEIYEIDPEEIIIAIEEGVYEEEKPLSLKIKKDDIEPNIKEISVIGMVRPRIKGEFKWKCLKYSNGDNRNCGSKDGDFQTFKMFKNKSYTVELLFTSGPNKLRATAKIPKICKNKKECDGINDGDEDEDRKDPLKDSWIMKNCPQNPYCNSNTPPQMINIPPVGPYIMPGVL